MLVACREADAETIATQVSLTEGRVLDAMKVLVGSGVVISRDVDRVTIGSRLFERWVNLYDPLPRSGDRRRERPPLGFPQPPSGGDGSS